MALRVRALRAVSCVGVSGGWGVSFWGLVGVGVGERDKGVRGVVRWIRVSGNWDALDWGRMNGEE